MLKAVEVEHPTFMIKRAVVGVDLPFSGRAPMLLSLEVVVVHLVLSIVEVVLLTGPAHPLTALVAAQE
jgi:hypothetical protein